MHPLGPHADMNNKDRTNNNLGGNDRTDNDLDDTGSEDSYRLGHDGIENTDVEQNIDVEQNTDMGHSIDVGHDWQYKGWPSSSCASDIRKITAKKPNLFTGDFMFPVATISTSRLRHNLRTVSQFCDDIGVSLAPHAKTTLSPEIIRWQLDAGAWAITAATANHARLFRNFGVPRVLIAHELVDPAGVRWAANELAADPEAEILCLADSVAGVQIMEDALSKQPEGRPIDVLVELGIAGGRSGCRSVAEALEVAARVAASPRLRLVGAEAYEGIIGISKSSLAAVDDLLHRLRSLVQQLEEKALLDHLEEVIVSAGGSMYTDRVADVLTSKWKLSKPVRVVLRPGCYVTHDSRHYAESAPFGLRTPMDSYPELQPALTIWSYVVSRPEPGLALLGFGKFDASYDVHLPTPVSVRRRGHDDSPRPLAGELELARLDDQHAYMRVPEDFSLSVGDVVGCGISHPCTTFERWRVIPLIDNDHNVTGAIRTFF